MGDTDVERNLYANRYIGIQGGAHSIESIEQNEFCRVTPRSLLHASTSGCENIAGGGNAPDYLNTKQNPPGYFRTQLQWSHSSISRFIYPVVFSHFII